MLYNHAFDIWLIP